MPDDIAEQNEYQPQPILAERFDFTFNDSPLVLNAEINEKGYMVTTKSCIQASAIGNAAMEVKKEELDLDDL